VLHKINDLQNFRTFAQPIITHDKVKCPQNGPREMGWRWVDENSPGQVSAGFYPSEQRTRAAVGDQLCHDAVAVGDPGIAAQVDSENNRSAHGASRVAVAAGEEAGHATGHIVHSSWRHDRPPIGQSSLCAHQRFLRLRNFSRR